SSDLDEPHLLRVHRRLQLQVHLRSSPMDEMSIGEIGRLTGLKPSAIRYYESLGLLPKPKRVGGKRRYDATVLEWLSLIALAREAGFTMTEIKRLVAGFTPGTRPA